MSVPDQDSQAETLLFSLAGRGGGEMAALGWGPADRPVDLLFLHANGFNALTYRRLLAPLGDRWRVLAVDQRGHGATTFGAEPAGRDDWSDLAGDILALAKAADIERAVLAGHSMGATAAALAAAENPAIARRLLLVDPVILPRGQRITPASPEAHGDLARGALRRRRDFADRAAALAAYRGRGAFAGWNEFMLADYVGAGFKESGDSVTLACAPEWEASNYRAHGHDAWTALAAYPGPTMILKAGEASTCSVEEDRAAFPRLTVRTVMGAAHFLPMQAPDLVRAALAEALAADEAG